RALPTQTEQHRLGARTEMLFVLLRAQSSPGFYRIGRSLRALYQMHIGPLLTWFALIVSLVPAAALAAAQSPADIQRTADAFVRKPQTFRAASRSPWLRSKTSSILRAARAWRLTFPPARACGATQRLAFAARDRRSGRCSFQYRFRYGPTSPSARALYLVDRC